MKIERIHDQATNNIEAIDKYDMCGCFYCISTFPSEEIMEFTDDGNTALCPRCGVDSVIPGQVNGFFLEAAYKYWFTGEE